MKDKEDKFKLPDDFEEFTGARREGFIKMKELKEKGERVVGVYCTYTPLAIIYAAGLIPLSLCSSSNDAIKYAEVDLPKNLCPLIKASYGVAVSDTCPYFYFADLIVGETTCDGKKKMYELMNNVKDTYILHLPQKYDESSFQLWLDELYKFKEELERRFGVKITEEKLKQAIKIGNEERCNLRDFFALGKLNPPPLSGADMSAIQEGFSFNFDRVKRNKDLKQKTLEVYEKWKTEIEGKQSKKRPRILVTGCPIIGVREKILRCIEASGGDIVVYENCSGIREKMELIDEEGDAMKAIARKYLGIPCSVMSPNPKRFVHLESLIDEYEISGVVEIVLQACHTFAIEASTIQKFVK